MFEMRTRRTAGAGVGAAALAAAFLLAGGLAAQASPEPIPVTRAPAPIPVAPAPSAPAATCAFDAPASPEALQLARSIVRIQIDSEDDVFLRAAMKGFNLHGLGAREAELQGYVTDSFKEAFVDAKPRLETLFTHVYATHFTLAELRAGARFMTGPGGRYIEDLRDRGETNRKVGAVPAAVSAAVAQLESTPAGRRFMRESVHTDNVLLGCEQETAATIVPSFLLHVTEKVEAAQARRAEAARTAPDAPSPEAIALGVSAAHGLYQVADDRIWSLLGSAVSTGLTKSFANNTAMRPEWAGLFSSTAVETLRQDQPKVEQSVGRMLARIYDQDELKALAEFANGPAPAYYVKAAMAKQGGVAVGPTPPEVQAATDKLTKTDMARRLGERLKDGARAKPVMIDLAFDLAPLWIHRFAEQAQAAEAARWTARGW